MESRRVWPEASAVVRVMICHPTLKPLLEKDWLLDRMPSRSEHHRYWQGSLSHARA
jgi:hypothetical protein